MEEGERVKDVENIVKMKLQEIDTLRENMVTNESIQNEMQINLDTNIIAKQKLQSMLMRFENNKRRDVLELQVSLSEYIYIYILRLLYACSN